MIEFTLPASFKRQQGVGCHFLLETEINTMANALPEALSVGAGLKDFYPVSVRTAVWGQI
jgi:hypothetical protein